MSLQLFTGEWEAEFGAPPASAPAWSKPAGPKIGEIKAHNAAGIRAGIGVLRSVRAKEVAGKKSPLTPLYLVTYSHELPPPRSGDLQFVVHVLVPDPGVLAGTTPIPRRGTGPTGWQTWLGALGTWSMLPDPIPAKQWPMATWYRRVGATTFGSMVEAVLRPHFTSGGIYGRSTTAAGADLRSKKEIADFLAELAAELAG